MLWEWFNTAAHAASLMGLILAAPRREMQAGTQQALKRVDERWLRAMERMDQRADQRHREVIDAITALRR
jgi:hypothetical protein